ncbi:MAG: transposase [Sandaracinaceae bacterium]
MVQRFGSALNLSSAGFVRSGADEVREAARIKRRRRAPAVNLHFHILAIDGAYHPAADGRVLFTRIAAPTEDEVAELTDTIAERVRRLLVRRGIWEDDLDGGRLQVDEAPPLADLYDAAVRGVGASGPGAGRPLERQGTRFALEPGSTFREGDRPPHGFDLHASVVVGAKRRDRLEALCRYLLRPPVSDDRLEALPDGRYRLRLKTAWRDGTSHLLLSAHELLNRLAALVPAPRRNQVVYHGVLAGRSAWRREVLPDAGTATSRETSSVPPRRNPSWAELLRRGLDIDGLACPKDGCAVRLRFVAVILRRDVIDRILAHLGLAPRAPPRPPKRPPGQLALPGM